MPRQMVDLDAATGSRMIHITYLVRLCLLLARRITGPGPRFCGLQYQRFRCSRSRELLRFKPAAESPPPTAGDSVGAPSEIENKVVLN